MENKKGFKLFDAILTVICVVFVVEAAPIVAQMGNSQYFWWVFLILTFLVPYGLISAELSTVYPDEGGLYDWVKRAFGKKWGIRVSWYYYINFPIWIGSLALLFTPIINYFFDPSGEKETINSIWGMVIGLLFIWICIIISFFKISDSKFVLNLGAILKVLLAILLLILGIMTFSKNGFHMASPATLKSFLPIQGFSIPEIILGFGATTIILFNFMGFEVIASFSKDMKKPEKDIPKAVIIAGLVIAFIYIAAGFGIGSAIPTNKITANLGIIEAINTMIGGRAFWIVVFAGILFLITLFGNIVSWSYGVNYVAQYGAQNNDMPKIFKPKSAKNDIPTGAPIVNGIVASLLVIAATIIHLVNPSAENMFFSFFKLSIITLLLSYIPIFPAFLKLRRIDSNITRPYKVPGKKGLLKVFSVAPVVILITTIVLSLAPIPEELNGTLQFTKSGIETVLPTVIGVIIAVIIGEVMVIVLDRKNKE